MTILEVAELAGVERKQIRGERPQGGGGLSTCYNLFMRVGMLAISGQAITLSKSFLDNTILYLLICLDQPPVSFPLPSSVSVE